VNAWRIVQRNAWVYRRVWRGSLFSSFVQPTLFLLAMGIGLGGMVDADAAALPGNVPYLDFLAPGLLAAACMQTAAFESSWPITGKLVWHKNYDAMLAAPLGVTDLVFGELAWIAVRLSTVATAFAVTMAVFGALRWSSMLPLALAAAVLTGLTFSAPIIAYAATLTKGNEFNVVFRFGITPLFLFSGVFFPIDRLPDPLEAVAWLTPLFHGVELVRGLVMNAPSPTWPVHLGYLALMLAGGIAAARSTFRRRLCS
jgi:lipooligosaccharide transport system permease protein